MSKTKSLRDLPWSTILSVASIFTVLFGLLAYRLASITPALSLTERHFVNTSTTVSGITGNPLYLPMKLPIFALHALGQGTPYFVRAVGAFYGLLTVLLFYSVVRRWYTGRVALLVSFLFLVSSWFLQTARLALPLVLLPFGTMLLVALSYYFYAGKSKAHLLWIVGAIGLLLYIPTMLWLMLALLIWQSKNVVRSIRKYPAWLHLVAILLLGIVLVPLAWAVVHNPDIGLQALGIPKDFMPIDMAKRLILIPVFLVARGPMEFTFNLGQLPLLDVFTTVLFILGVYWYWLNPKLVRTKLIGVLIVVAGVAAAVNGIPYVGLLLPLIFLVAAAGMALLLQQWFTVFPKNPIARSIGVVVVAIVIALTGAYHIRRYFIAWSGSPITKTKFIYPLDR